jgi:hypothetical protein
MVFGNSEEVTQKRVLDYSPVKSNPANPEELKKEYYRQLVNINVPGLQTKQYGPIYGFKKLQLDNPPAGKYQSPISNKVANSIFKKALNPNLVDENYDRISGDFR